MTSSERLAAPELVGAVLAHLGIEHEPGARAGEWVCVLPGEARLRTTVSLLVSDRGVTAVAFVVRRPDEATADVHQWLLQRNLRQPGVSFAVDHLGDVYAVARAAWALPADAQAAHEQVETCLDDMLGAILRAADSAFNPLLSIGFASAIRREWAWREERGESLTNLEAFRELVDRDEPRADGAGAGHAGTLGP